jgi:hypothetical protein
MNNRKAKRPSSGSSRNSSTKVVKGKSATRNSKAGLVASARTNRKQGFIPNYGSERDPNTGKFVSGNKADKNAMVLAATVGGAVIGNMLAPGIGGAVFGGLAGALVGRGGKGGSTDE